MMDFGALLDSLFRLGDTPRTVSFRVANRTVHAFVPQDSIFFSMKDILYNREYELYPGFELLKMRKTVVDAGANAGLYTIIASIFSKKVIGLEPDPDNFRTLSRNLAANKVVNAVALKSALWSSDGQVQFRKRRSSQLGSIKVHDDSTVAETVEAISLPHLLDRIGTEENRRDIDLLKLDIEGAEFDVFRTCDDKTLNRVSRIVAEIHIDQGDHREITSKLGENEFSYVILDRPARKVPDNNVQVISDYRVKFMLTVVDSIMKVSHYHDPTSVLLYASKDYRDFLFEERQLQLRTVESHILKTQN